MDKQKKIQRDIDYQKKNIKRLNLAFNINTDADILRHLDGIPNKNEYIKKLIRKDMLFR